MWSGALAFNATGFEGGIDFGGPEKASGAGGAGEEVQWGGAHTSLK